MLYSYSFSNRKRDLSDIFSTVIAEEPRFISNFKNAGEAIHRKHEWMDDQLSGRAITAAAGNGVLTVSAGDAGKLKKGTLIALKDDSALFAVESISGNSVTIRLAAENGSGLTAENLPENASNYIIVSTPMAEGTFNGDGDDAGNTGSVDWNSTQIFRKEIVLSGTALAMDYGHSTDTLLNRQTAFALAELSRDLNRVALFGRRVEAMPGVRGEAGGLYYFCTGDDALNVAAGNKLLDSFIINDAAQMIMGEGGEPTQILCSPGQARVLSHEYKDKLQILRSDDRRGAYVAVIVNEVNGRGLTIMADPDVPDGDAWVMDPAGFGIASLRGRAISDEDSTPKGFDGICRVALGELTFEFRNVKQRVCRISGLQKSADALRTLRA